jgi:hypothetical protein
MAKWFKVNDTLYNSDKVDGIKDPTFIQMPNTPGQWQIEYKDDKGSIWFWMFYTESECKSAHKHITKVLTGSFKFLE